MVSEWINEWWTNERMNEWMNGRQMNEWLDEQMNKWTNERMNTQARRSVDIQILSINAYPCACMLTIKMH